LHMSRDITLAERVGFEPTDHLTMVNALAGRPIRPLWHLSGAWAVYANAHVNGTGVGGGATISLSRGTVAERTIAAALKAAGRKARGFESLPFRWQVLCRVGACRLVSGDAL
jgi:hypothetical protein